MHVPVTIYCCASLYVHLQLCSPEEHKAIDKMIDVGKVEAGTVKRQIILSKHLPMEKKKDLLISLSLSLSFPLRTLQSWSDLL